MIKLQLYSIAFAIVAAYVNKIPCEKFRRVGTSLREDKIFHRANGLLKILFVFFVIQYGSIVSTLMAAFLSFIWLWLVFDIALNGFIDNGLFYTGSTAQIDKWQRKHFGEAAAVYKFIFCVMVIVAINIIYYKIVI